MRKNSAILAAVVSTIFLFVSTSFASNPNQTNNQINPPPNYNYMQKILSYRSYNIQKFISTLPKKEKKKFLQQYENSQQQIQQLQMQSIQR